MDRKHRYDEIETEENEWDGPDTKRQRQQYRTYHVRTP